MRALRSVAAVVYGFALFYAVGIWLTGFMAARQVPVGYFRFFDGHGVAGQEMGHALLAVAMHVVPTVGLLVAGVLLPAWRSRGEGRAVGTAVLIGGVLGGLFWMFFDSLHSQGGSGIRDALAVYLQAPWWAVPAMAGPWVGFAVAYAVLRRLPARSPGAGSGV